MVVYGCINKKNKKNRMDYLINIDLRINKDLM